MKGLSARPVVRRIIPIESLTNWIEPYLVKICVFSGRNVLI
jgi:hypothetical protein